MPTVTFTPNLERHLQCPPIEVPGSTVREVLESALRENQKLNHYIFDDQGRLRKHVMRALSGGEDGEWAIPRKGEQL
jgi:hypothetical protein